MPFQDFQELPGRTAAAGDSPLILRKSSLWGMAMVVAARLLLACFAAAGVPLVGAFSDGQELSVLATHVGPVNNPSETYPYFVLPFCPVKDAGGAATPSQDFADSLAGDRKVKTAYALRFKKNENLQACEMTLGENDLVCTVPVPEMSCDNIPAPAPPGSLFDRHRGGMVW